MRFSTFALTLALLTVSSATPLSGPPLHGRQDARRPLTRQNDQVPFPSNPTEAQFEAAYAAVCNETNSAVSQKVLRGDMEEFGSSAILSNAMFKLIGTQLAAIDEQKLNNGTLFAPKWAEITQEWTNILWASQATALNTAAYCTHFTKDIMPLVVNLSTPIPTDAGTTMAGAVLANYSAMAAHLETEAQSMSDAFTVLRNSITAFTQTFRSFAVNEKAVDQMMIDSLEANIAILRAQIDGDNIKLAQLGVALALTIVGAPVASAIWTFWFKRIITAGVLAIVGEVVELKNIFDQQSSDVGQVNTALIQIHALQAQLPAISAASYSLEMITTTAESIGKQLMGFNDLWNAVRSDGVAVQSYLKTLSSNSTLARQPAIYWGTRNKVPCTYEAIASALNIFSRHCGLPDPSTVS
ncbi:hypothetical protein DFH09DRAFT_1333870 [Mycena vulgaris]|nr:hypothetical protein DFH09DRAFT_1333826 [Mycena vulgaris]KAJ6511260.1 hypothetical protein DFH09DRAFT_1333870 [Mycena vulgaris]